MCANRWFCEKNQILKCLKLVTVTGHVLLRNAQINYFYRYIDALYHYFPKNQILYVEIDNWTCLNVE